MLRANHARSPDLRAHREQVCTPAEAEILLQHQLDYKLFHVRPVACRSPKWMQHTRISKCTNVIKRTKVVLCE